MNLHPFKISVSLMSSLSQATPPLLSLSVRRTVDTLLTMETGDATSNVSQPLNTKSKDEPSMDHSLEFQKVQEILEQQCFAFVAFRNQIRDARDVQNKIMQRFHERASAIENRLTQVSTSLLQKAQELNQRVDIISKTLAPKPIFRHLLPPNDYGRITGIKIQDQVLAITTSSGQFIGMKKDTYEVEVIQQPFPNESLFSPNFLVHQSTIIALTVTSGRKLLIHLPYTAYPAECFDGKVECFSVSSEAALSEGYEVVIGQASQILFCNFLSDNPKKLNVTGSTKKIRGTVTHIVTDNDNEAVYALTSRRMFYSVSGSTFQIITQTQFQTPLMQLALTRVFIVISCAPNDIILGERNRDKFNQIFKITIDAGLRRFCCGTKYILIIRKDQRIERRMLCQIGEPESICEPDAADYDPEDYIGSVYCEGPVIYLSHGSRISIWS